jgi:hypothetical protein
MNQCATAATRLTMTSQHGSEALRLGYDPFMSIRSDESSMVELWWGGSYYAMKRGLSRKPGGKGSDAIVIFRGEGFREFSSGHRT